MGTSLTTLLKRNVAPTVPGATPIHYRDFWGRADLKRRALVESLEMKGWDREAMEQGGATAERAP